MPMPSRQNLQYLSNEASVYSNSDVVVIEEDYVSGDERDVVYLDDQRNVIYCEEPAPLEDTSPGMVSNTAPRCRVLLGSPPRAQGGGDREVNLVLL